MMKIILAKNAGFCMGVRRAVEMVLEAAAKHPPPIYTFGPLIHNPQVLSILQDKGISVLDHIPEKGGGTVLIRAHGVPPETKQRLKTAGFTVLDATCPHVIKVQTIIRKHTRNGAAAIIVGDRDHPEVVGLVGYAGENGYVVANVSELAALEGFKNAIVVAQTTQNSRLFQDVHRWVERHAPHYAVFNTICDSTEKRQAEAKQLASQVDAVVVVGGHNSGNTTRLAQIVEQSGKPVYHVETEAELAGAGFASVQTIGITAGASTPNWIIKKVYRTLESLGLTKEKGWRGSLFSLQRTLLLTSIYLAIGAGSVCYACMRLQGLPASLGPVLMSMLYVLSMHAFNHLTGRKADQYNDPDRAQFYIQHRAGLTGMAVVSGVACLIIACVVGWIPFLILLGMSATGISYNIRLIPGWFKTGRYRRIRDIPGSKTVLIALAWGLITAVVPPLAMGESPSVGTLLVFFWATSMIFVRTAFFDLLDIQGDRIVGRETIPILLGEERTVGLLKSMLIGAAALLLVSILSGRVVMPGVLLMLCSGCLYAVLHFFENGRLLPGIGLEFLIESHLVLTGFLAWAGRFLTGGSI